MGRRYYVDQLAGSKHARWVVRDAEKDGAIIGKPSNTEQGAINRASQLNDEHDRRIWAAAGMPAQSIEEQAPKAPEPTQELSEGKGYSKAVQIAMDQLAARQAESREMLMLAAGRYHLLGEELERLAQDAGRQLSDMMIEAISLSQRSLYSLDASSFARQAMRVGGSERLHRTMVLREERNRNAQAANGPEEISYPEELQP